MSVETQGTVSKRFSKRGSVLPREKDDVVFADDKYTFDAAYKSGEGSDDADFEALDQMGSGSTVGGLSSSFSGMPTHSETVQIEPGHSD